MKFKALSIGLLSLSAMSSVLFVSRSAQAVCVGVDVPTQIAIHGVNDEATQYSESQFDVESGCFGSTTVNTGTQVHTGQGDIHQEQVNSHHLGGNDQQNTYVDPYLESVDPFVISVPTQVDLNVLPDSSYLDGYGTDYGFDDDFS